MASREKGRAQSGCHVFYPTNDQLVHWLASTLPLQHLNTWCSFSLTSVQSTKTVSSSFWIQIKKKSSGRALQSQSTPSRQGDEASLALAIAGKEGLIQTPILILDSPGAGSSVWSSSLFHSSSELASGILCYLHCHQRFLTVLITYWVCPTF